MDINDLQNTLVTIYQKNINYFKKSNIELFNKIQLFEQKNIENWYIDFVDNRFELSNINGEKIYNCDPFYDAQYRADNIHHSPAFSLINENGYYHGMNKYEDTTNAYEYVNALLEEKQQKSSSLNQKYIFIGTLLGIHINDMHRLKKAVAYLIIEPNIEIFRLSLFLCDYTELSNSSRIFFCVDFDDYEFNTTVKKFLDYKYEYNHIIPFELASNNEIYLIEKLNIQLLDNSEMIYPFSEYIVSLKRGFRYFKESQNKILNISPNKKYLENLPILFLGAGPSLASNIEWIYMNQDKFIIIAASATLKRLELLRIIPDIIFVVDGGKKHPLEQFNVSSTMFLDSIVCASIHIDYDLFKILNNDKLFFIQNSLELFNGYGISTGLTVGDSGIDLILRFGVKEVYMLGFDAALRGDGKTHDGLHSSSKYLDVTQNKQHRQTLDYDRHIIWVKGNFLKEVPTTMLYNSMIEQIENILINSPQTKVYNLSNGAFFKGSIACHAQDCKFDDMPILDKTKLLKHIINLLHENCKRNLSKKDKEELIKEKKVLKKLESIINHNFYIEFQKTRSNYKNSITIQIVNKYLKLIMPYVEYYGKTDILQLQVTQIIQEIYHIITDIQDDN